MRLSSKIHPLLFAVFFLGFSALPAAATTYYVDINSTSPTPPYTSWSTASTDIQGAVNIANSGDTVLVTNGVYQTGGQVTIGTTINRVAISKPLHCQER